MSDIPETLWVGIRGINTHKADIGDIEVIRMEDALKMVAAEREACAKVAETSHERWQEELTAHEVECDVTACQDIAEEIRKRGVQDGCCAVLAGSNQEG